MPRKIFVLDTSVFIHDPNCLNNFNEGEIIIPITVLEELDKLKSYHDEKGYSARQSIRVLDVLGNNKDIFEGVALGESGAKIKFDAQVYSAFGEDKSYGDNKIVATALTHHRTGAEVILVSRDIALRVKARALGIGAETYEKDNRDREEIYQGTTVVEHSEVSNGLIEDGFCSLQPYPEFDDMYPNEYILFVDENNKGVCVGRKTKGMIKLVKEQSPWGLKSKNFEQMCLLDAIMDTNVHLVSSSGCSGSGKSLCSLAGALELVLTSRKYDNLIIFKSAVGIENEETGYLPGSLDEKMGPIFGSVEQSFQFLMGDNSRSKDSWKTKLHQYISNGMITFESLNFARGKSFNNSLILVEEFQNLSPKTAKLILTRVGMGSKIIIAGDTAQVDNKKGDAIHNGLHYTVEKFKDSSLSAHINFTNGVRSPLSALASEIM